MFKEMKLGNTTVKGVEYIFRDPPLDGPRMARATNAAILLEDGRLFIGCAVCAESEQFFKDKGREIALAEARAKTSKGVGGGVVMPDAILNLEIDVENFDEMAGGNSARINQTVKMECLYYQLEKFRTILYNRHVLLEAADELLAHDVGRVL